MKRTLLFISAVLLSMLTVTTFTSCGDDEEDDIIVSPDNGNNGQQSPNIIVTVDANGNAKGGHRFVKIDEANFYIDDIKYTAVSGDLEVTGYDKAYFNGVARIISKLIYNGRTMKVVRIANDAFMSCSALTSVTFPETLTSIGLRAFYGCKKLTDITIPDNVTYLDEFAFGGTGLKSVYIGSGVKYISTEAYSSFYCCYDINSIKVSTSNLYYDSRYDCNAIIEKSTRKLILACNNTFIPEGVVSIAYYAFNGCTKGPLSVTIPNSMTSISHGAFRGYTALTSVTIPNSVKSIQDYAFYGCNKLTSITIPDNVTSIGGEAFHGCSKMTSVIIGNGVKSLAMSAFIECYSLSTITIGSGVTSMTGENFSNCSRLADVYCYAQDVPLSSNVTFYKSSLSSATLHVPAGSISSYKESYPWNRFRSIVAIE